MTRSRTMPSAGLGSLQLVGESRLPGSQVATAVVASGVSGAPRSHIPGRRGRRCERHVHRRQVSRRFGHYVRGSQAASCRLPPQARSSARSIAGTGRSVKGAPLDVMIAARSGQERQRPPDPAGSAADVVALFAAYPDRTGLEFTKRWPGGGQPWEPRRACPCLVPAWQRRRCWPHSGRRWP
jgi:hypothetical protein